MNKILIILLSVFLLGVACPVTDCLNFAFEFCEVVDTDAEESSNKKEVEDDVDELFASIQDMNWLNQARNVNLHSIMIHYLMPPVFVVPSPPPEY